MTRTPLNSTLVQAVSYDPTTKVAHVELVNRGTYEYHDVPPEDIQAFLGSSSHGGHFSRVFKTLHGHKAKKIA